MKGLRHLLIFLTLSMTIGSGMLFAGRYADVTQPDDPSVTHILLNGRIWFNRFPRVQGDPFFINDTFRKGSVVFNGRSFTNLDIRYDINDDELILSILGKPIIIMNKEMVDSFDISFDDRIYHVINAGNDTASVLKGYVNVLYNGPSTFYVKYSKKIMPLAVDGKFDLFYQEHRMYIKMEQEIIPLSGRGELMKLFEPKIKEIKKYLRDNNIRISKKDPFSFVPVIEYYDSLNN